MLIYVGIKICRTFYDCWSFWTQPSFDWSPDGTLDEGHLQSLWSGAPASPRTALYADFPLKAQLPHLTIGLISCPQRADGFEGDGEHFTEDVISPSPVSHPHLGCRAGSLAGSKLQRVHRREKTNQFRRCERKEKRSSQTQRARVARGSSWT